MVVGVVIVYKLVAIISNAVMSSCFYGYKTSLNAGRSSIYCLYVYIFSQFFHSFFTPLSLDIKMKSLNMNPVNILV